MFKEKKNKEPEHNISEELALTNWSWYKSFFDA